MNIMYYGDGQGGWWRREWKQQCPEKVAFYGPCQGIVGHEGFHWCYDYQGSLCQADPRKDLKPMDIACGSIPPGHRDYISPEKMRDQFYLSARADAEVTDPEVLKMLEGGETPEKGASMTQPLKSGETLEDFAKKHQAQRNRRT